MYSLDGLYSLFDKKVRIDGQIALSKRNNNNGLGYNYELSYSNEIKTSVVNFLKNSIIELWYNKQYYDRDFDINDIGYLVRNNYKENDIGIVLSKIFTNSKIIHRSLNIRIIQSKSIKNLDLLNQISLDWEYKFKNNWFLNYTIIKTFTYYDDWISHDYKYNSDNPSLIVKKTRI